MELPAGHVGCPELGRVADKLGHRESLAESIVGVLPHAASLCDLPAQPPSLDQILPRPRPRGTLQALVGMPARLVEVAARECQFAQAGEEVDGVAPAHPFARRRVPDEVIHPLEIVPSQGEVALEQGDVPEVELSIGERFMITAPVATLGSALVELAGPIEIAALHVEPPQRVEVAWGVVLVTDSLRQRESLVEAGQRAIIRALPSEVDPGHEHALEGVGARLRKSPMKYARWLGSIGRWWCDLGPGPQPADPDGRHQLAISKPKSNGLFVGS